MLMRKTKKPHIGWNYWIDLQLKNGIKPRKKDYKPTSAFDVKQLNSNNIRSIASYVTKYVANNDAKFRCQIWDFYNLISALHKDFYITTEFVDQFRRLNGVLKEYEVKNHIEGPFLNIKMIDLNRQTLPLCNRLYDKNKATRIN